MKTLDQRLTEQGPWPIPVGMQQIQISPIGIIKSCYKDRFGTPRQSDLVPSAEAWIELDARVQPEFSLVGLDGFTHLWVIFHFHKNTNQKFTAKVHPPRMEGESVGVYATRSPHRPNAIGMSLVEIREIKDGRIRIGAHDLIDGTPVLDIKPYLKESESKPLASSGWGEGKPYSANLEVLWSESALKFIRAHHNDADKFQRLVSETLKLDPRPQVYKGQGQTLREKHAVRFEDLDVHFEFPDTKSVQVVEVKFWTY